MNILDFDRKDLDQEISKHIHVADVVLDIGCGIRPQTLVRPKLMICCEPHQEYVEILQRRFARRADVVILKMTGLQALSGLPDRSVDSVFLNDLIEHLEKDEGEKLIQECDRVARKQIVLFSPSRSGAREYESGNIDNQGLHVRERQTHKSGWTPEDFDSSWKILKADMLHTHDGKGESFNPSYGAFWAIRDCRQEKDTNALKSPKIAVVSHVFPPSPSGQAKVLYRLLENWHPDRYCLLSTQKYDRFQYGGVATDWLSGDYIQLPTGRLTSVLKAIWNRFPFLSLPFTIIIGLISIFLRAYKISRLIQREECGAIVACTGDLFDVPASFLASSWSRKSLYVYMFDWYAHQWRKPAIRRLVGYLEHYILKRTRAVIVPNEALQEELGKLYSVKTTVIHNPYDDQNIERTPVKQWPFHPSQIRIVYTGAIYDAHYDAFRNLFESTNHCIDIPLEIHLYTAQSIAELEKHLSIRPNVIVHPHLPPKEIAEIQREADILFLPLAFHSKIEPVLRTSAPGKMGEYLASGRPVLVHAPADMFLSRYFQTHKCGVVVDVDDPQKLAESIREIVEDATLRIEITQNAMDRALSDFTGTQAQIAFRQVFTHDSPS